MDDGIEALAPLSYAVVPCTMLLSMVQRSREGEN